MSEQLVWTEEEAAEMKERFQRRFGEPLPRTESLFAVAAVGYRKGLNTRPSPTEIEALRAEVERLNRILGHIVEGDGDSTVTIRAGRDAFAAAKEYLLRDQGRAPANRAGLIEPTRSFAIAAQQGGAA